MSEISTSVSTSYRRLTEEGFVNDLVMNRVVFARGSRRSLNAELARVGAQRVMLICEPAGSAWLPEVVSQVGGRLVGCTERVRPHVPAELVASVADECRRHDVDSVVTLGGGSTTGLAKALARELPLNIVAMPTTFAGSEATPIWGVTRDGVKTTGRDIRVLPRTVIYDADLVDSLPAQVATASAFNGISHAVEAIYARDASPIVKLIATEGLASLTAAVRALVRGADPASARQDALYGSWLCGIALTNSAMGVHHKVAHILGGAFDLPHAPMHAVLLPFTVAFNTAHAASETARICEAMGVQDGAGGIWRLQRELGMSTEGLRGFGVPREALDEVASQLADIGVSSPRRVGEEEACLFLSAAWEGSESALARLDG